jgi:Zn-dependent alcohol dehydrogenase
MRAALYEAGNTTLAISDVDIDDPAPGRVRVRVHHCGICHSDYTALHSTYGASPSVLGHEAAGVVDAVGEGVTMVAPGDKVVLTPIAPCGRCYWCQRDQPGCCVNNAAVLGGAFLDGSTGLAKDGQQVYRGLGVGGFAEYAMCNETGAVKVPDDTPLDTACVIGCAVQTGVGAVLNTAQVEPGATVLVLGLGGIGLSVVQGARAAGAAQVIASDPLDWRRNAASQMGATTVLDPNVDDVLAATRDLTSVGADYAFECAGIAALAAVGVEATRAGGSTVLVGAPPLEGKLELDPLVLFGISEKKLMGCFLGSCNSLRDIPRLVAMWCAGQLDLEALVTARRPLEEINDAFADLAAGVGIRTVIDLV